MLYKRLLAVLVIGLLALAIILPLSMGQAILSASPAQAGALVGTLSPTVSGSLTPQASPSRVGIIVSPTPIPLYIPIIGH